VSSNWPWVSANVTSLSNGGRPLLLRVVERRGKTMTRANHRPIAHWRRDALSSIAEDLDTSAGNRGG
jgi:hypothetical protein